MTSTVQTQFTTAEVSVAGNSLQMVRIALVVIALWTVASAGYFALVAALGVESGRDDAPVLFAAYYLDRAALGATLTPQSAPLRANDLVIGTDHDD